MPHTKKILLYLLLLALFVALSIIALHAAKELTHTSITPPTHTESPDFFMTNAISTKFNIEGHINSRMQSSSVQHFEHENTYNFTQPHITIYHTYEEPWHISAKYGDSKAGKTTLHFWDDVKIIRAAGKYNTYFDITTSEATVYPDKKFATTQQPVTILQSGLLTKAVGAAIDLKTGIVKLVSQIESQYQIK